MVTEYIDIFFTGQCNNFLNQIIQYEQYFDHLKVITYIKSKSLLFPSETSILSSLLYASHQRKFIKATKHGYLQVHIIFPEIL